MNLGLSLGINFLLNVYQGIYYPIVDSVYFDNEKKQKMEVCIF